MDGYEPDHETVSRFVELTNADPQQARFLLEASHGNVDVAASMYFEQLGTLGFGHAPSQRANAPPPPPSFNAFPQATPPRPPAPVGAHSRNPRASGSARFLETLFNIPFSIFRLSLAFTSFLFSWSFSTISFIGSRVLPGRVVRLIQGFTTSLQRGLEEPDPAIQAQQFIQTFKAQYGDRHPRFVDLPWRQAAARAQAEFKLLFIYVHSSEHQDTERFCRETLCAPEIVDFVNQHFVSWGGDLRQKDPFTLAGRLSAATYPYIALLVGAGSRIRLVASVQGWRGPAQLLAELQRAVEEHGALLVAQRAEQEEREVNRRLLAEQNEEYEKTLAADRERSRLREEERRRQEAAEQARQEEEAKARAAVLAEEQRKADRQAELVERRMAKRAALPEEPSPGEPAALLRVRLPDGSNHQRRFPAAATLQVLFDFVDSMDATTFWTYSLAINYPRKVFQRTDSGQSLTEAGLVPQGVLFVQPEWD